MVWPSFTNEEKAGTRVDGGGTGMPVSMRLGLIRIGRRIGYSRVRALSAGRKPDCQKWIPL